MSDLEQLTKKYFERYYLAKGVKDAKWHLLSKQRKAIWMEEVLEVANFFVSQLKEQVKPVVANPYGSTSYTMGYNDGVRLERVQFIGLVDTIYENLNNNLQDIQEEEKSD